jgi:hypothetical protein
MRVWLAKSSTVKPSHGYVEVIEVCLHVTSVVMDACFDRGVSVHDLRIDTLIEEVCYANDHVGVLLGR